jgi:ATP-dependent Lon protease
MSEDRSKIPNEDEPKERHYTIFYGETGYSYESIIGPYLRVVKEITIEDPYIRVAYQIHDAWRPDQ